MNNKITDISMYDKNDEEHVGWYYIPVENGKETWINPYFNKNMGVEMISYVILTHYEADETNILKIFRIKIIIPIKRNITALNYEILSVFYGSFYHFTHYRPE